MLVFALKGSAALGDRVAACGGLQLAPHEEREFDGGEHKARPLVDVAGQDVVVLQSLHGCDRASANDKLLRLLFFVGACRDHGARRVTAVAPYLAYSRKDRRTKPQDPVTARYVAQLFEAVGASAVVTLEVHNLAAFENAFRCPTLHLSTDGLFADHIAAGLAGPGAKLPPAVVSPDLGGVKRAQLLREALEARTGVAVPFGFMEKRRSAGVVSGTLFAGEVAGCAVYIVDDMICGGGTILRAAKAARAHGAAEVHALAAHGLMTDAALEVLSRSALLDSIAISDGVEPCPAFGAALGARLRIVTCAPLLAEALARLHPPPGTGPAARGGSA
ncbi:ribose-phosphate diphosphokinase [Roseibacterium sp. SDUM158017]|uniref:ribose-phosphate diphosphokinase n=1 Tax=Roseicyclus salinarum TaxID=3036773 RepID=UPI002414E8DD|nr:ribose-phosphate diphosphokinase [Roseibacterium sp. SDUM158017]MDG4648446.1 ribose-phosphate diphosphokinase [Roseibacterium sp. SDUM158017]